MFSYWIYCLVTRRKDGSFRAFRNETEQRTLRAWSWEWAEEGWLLREAIDGEEPAEMVYHFTADRQTHFARQIKPAALPLEAAALVCAPSIQFAEAVDA